MIDVALKTIIDQLNTYLKSLSNLEESEVMLGSVSFIDAFQDVSSQNLKGKVIASVVNIEQEITSRTPPLSQKAISNNGKPISIRQPKGIFLNVYVLFAANMPSNGYEQALKKISQIISFFQQSHVFTEENVPGLADAGIEKLIWDIHTLRFEELNHLWGINGGKYIPSILYKVRMIIIQDAEPVETGVITALGENSEVI